MSLRLLCQQRVVLTLVLVFSLMVLRTPLPQAQSQSDAHQTIESDDPEVQQDGTWTAQRVNTASGGSYLYNTGEASLTLEFSGSSLDVWYVSGPTLGTLAIEVDGTVLRTVITTTDSTQFGQVASIHYLSNETHILKVYAQAGGEIGVDAFEVEDAQAADGTANGVVRVPCDPSSPVRLISVASDGTLANASTLYMSISDNGRWIVFSSTATNLVAGDTNATSDVFVYDSQTCTTTRVSIGSGGQSNGGSTRVDISGDGRYVAFESYATNLVTGDTNGVRDVFVRDLQTNLTTRVSVDSADNQVTMDAYSPAISSDGRYVAFVSRSANLVAGDTNNSDDIFVRDRQTATTTRVSLDSSGVEQNNTRSYSPSPSISADGSLVVFTSSATNLVPNDTNNTDDLFLRDRNTNQTSRLDVNTAGQQADGGIENSESRYSPPQAISADGQQVVFASFAASLVPAAADVNVFWRNRATNQTTLLSQAPNGQDANGDSYAPVISANGQWVAFYSSATNLTVDTNNAFDVYLRNLQTGSLRRVSISESGGQANANSIMPALSGDGRYVVFSSAATNLVSGDTNNKADIFIVDTWAVFPALNLTATSTTFGRNTLGWNNSTYVETEYRIERSPDGVTNWQQVGTTSANVSSYEDTAVLCQTAYYYRVRAYSSTTGQYSAYSNVASAVTVCASGCNLSATMRRVSLSSSGVEGNNDATNPAIAGYGRYVAFESRASNFVAGDTNGYGDVFVYDRETCQISRVSVASNGTQGNGQSFNPDISHDGRYVVFLSNANNLVVGDTNNLTDAFVRDRLTGETRRVSVSSAGAQANAVPMGLVISGDGRFVAYSSFASTLVASDTNGVNDVFVYEMATSQTTRVSISPTGQQGTSVSHTPTLSYDGRYIAFLASDPIVPAGGLVILDRQTGQFRQLSSSTLSIGELELSDDGRYLSFVSFTYPATAYVYDRQSATTTNVSVTSTGQPANVHWAGLSPDGCYSIFLSNDTLLPADTNSYNDAYIRDCHTATTRLLSANLNGQAVGAGGDRAGVSQNGRYAVFTGFDDAIVANDLNHVADIFVNGQTSTPALALFRSSTNSTSQLNTLQDLPPASAYNNLTLAPPAGANNGQWVMGDWNGDGLRTPGVYGPNGVFYITNQSGGAGSTWVATWIGLLGRPPVAGQFANVGHDCIGVVDSAEFPPYGTAFALYYTCNLAGGAPSLSFQWLSVILPSPTYTGTHQFMAGDFDSDGLDSIAIRRGAFIAYTNVAPVGGNAMYNLAQYWGVPPSTNGNEGIFVVGDWDLNAQDSFGVVYQNGNFYRRNDLQWNSGIYTLQRIGQPIGTPFTATTWQP